MRIQMAGGTPAAALTISAHSSSVKETSDLRSRVSSLAGMGGDATPGLAGLSIFAAPPLRSIIGSLSGASRGRAPLGPQHKLKYKFAPLEPWQPRACSPRAGSREQRQEGARRRCQRGPLRGHRCGVVAQHALAHSREGGLRRAGLRLARSLRLRLRSLLLLRLGSGAVSLRLGGDALAHGFSLDLLALLLLEPARDVGAERRVVLVQLATVLAQGADPAVPDLDQILGE